MEQEVKHLDYTLEKYDEVIEDSKLKLSNLREIYKHDYDAMLEEKFKLENEIQVKDKDENVKEIDKNGVVPIVNNLKIKFSDECVAEIKINNWGGYKYDDRNH